LLHRDVGVEQHRARRKRASRARTQTSLAQTACPTAIFDIEQRSKISLTALSLQRFAPEESMKLSPASLRTLRSTATLAPWLLAFAWLAGACSSSDTTTPPTNPPPDASGPMDDGAIPPPPEVDAGGIFCGSNYCPNKVVGGQRGFACCAGTAMNCGLNFGGLSGCVDQTDAGGAMPPMPPADAGVIVPDPSCGTVSLDFGGMMFALNGCCLASGTCGWYSPQMSNFGCVGADQIRMVGAPVTGLPDAPIACAPDGGPTP
jgi:hypothetical protein